MIRRLRSISALCFALTLCWGNPVKADGLNCLNPTTETEVAICNDPTLADMAVLAQVLGNIVGLDVRYAHSSIQEDLGLSNGLRRLLSTLTLAEAASLVDASQHLAWDVVFDEQNKILFINSDKANLQDGLVVFAPSAVGSSTPIYVEMELVLDAFRYRYRADGNILEARHSSKPASFTKKYRYQDGCWRLIGEEMTWVDYMIEYDNDMAAYSINHLTGQAIFDYKVETGVLRTFDPHIRCLDERLTYHEIDYHDANE